MRTNRRLNMSFHPLSLLTVLLPQAGDELLGGDDPHLLLLRGDAVEEVGQAGEQRLLTPGLYLHTHTP